MRVCVGGGIEKYLQKETIVRASPRRRDGVVKNVMRPLPVSRVAEDTFLQSEGIIDTAKVVVIPTKGNGILDVTGVCLQQGKPKENMDKSR